MRENVEMKLGKMHQLFDEKMNDVIDEPNEALAA